MNGWVKGRMMSRNEPKRNDPCPCGSGKLYKHCCKPGRRESMAQQREIALAPTLGKRASDRAGDPAIAEMRRLIEGAEGLVAPDNVKELERLLSMAEEMASLPGMGAEIEAAAQVLEAHRAEFEALAPYEILELAARLFAEERFRPLRFRPKDVQRAFEAVGYPGGASARIQDGDADLLRDGLLHVTTPELREYLARKLIVWMPEYVVQGRYMEAWMLQYCSFLMLETPEEGNPFLGEMFLQGFLDWRDQVRAEREALIHDFGLSREQVANMTPEQVEAWVEERLQDPETSVRLKALLEDTTLFRGQAQAEWDKLQQASFELLVRDDAWHFLLSHEEMSPWLTPLLERLNEIEGQATGDRETEWDEADVEKAHEVVVETGQGMAQALFDPKRIALLAEELKSYRHMLSEAGDKEGAMRAHAAAKMLESPDAPIAQGFMDAVAVTSLRWLLRAVGRGVRAEMDGEK
jgi:hypothetical protein